MLPKKTLTVFEPVAASSPKLPGRLEEVAPKFSLPLLLCCGSPLLNLRGAASEGQGVGFFTRDSGRLLRLPEGLCQLEPFLQSRLALLVLTFAAPLFFLKSGVG